MKMWDKKYLVIPAIAAAALATVLLAGCGGGGGLAEQPDPEPDPVVTLDGADFTEVDAEHKRPFDVAANELLEASSSWLEGLDAYLGHHGYASVVAGGKPKRNMGADQRQRPAESLTGKWESPVAGWYKYDLFDEAGKSALHEDIRGFESTAVLECAGDMVSFELAEDAIDSIIAPPKLSIEVGADGTCTAAPCT